MNTISSPMTPSECDLRGYEWMPLFGARLFASNFEAHASDLAFRVAIKLYWECWQQVPAASLPNEDVQLCRLAGLGRDLKTWRKLRADGVLHGFRLCSDDRLYHPMLAEEAIKAWECRVRKEAARTQTAERVRRFRERRACSDDDPVTQDVTRYNEPDNPLRNAPVTQDVTSRAKDSSTGQVQQVQEERKESSKNTFLSSRNVPARGYREQNPVPDRLAELLAEEGIEPPNPEPEEVPNVIDILDARDAARAELGQTGAVGAQIRRAAKALAMRIPYAEVRSVDAQLAALQEQPQVVGADATMGLRWAPAEPVRSVEEQRTALLAGCTPDQIARAQRYAARYAS